MYIPIDPNAETPIYKQIAQYLYGEITEGRIAHGAKLPTVRELAEKQGIARGTIKRAYDELNRMGGVEMKQGQGTFVIYDKRRQDSRKERAMITIDRLIDELAALGFSSAEMNIFFDLKLRERTRMEDEVHIILQGDSPELLFALAEQLYAIGGVNIYKCLSGTGLPIRADIGADIILTRHAGSASHPSGEGHIPPPTSGTDGSNAPGEGQFASGRGERCIPIASTIDSPTVASMARLGMADSVAAVALSEPFLNEMLSAVQKYAPDVRVRGITVADEGEIDSLLSDKSVILVPKGYETLFTLKTVASIAASGKKLIRFVTRMDDGSLLRLMETVELVRTERRRGLR